MSPTDGQLANQALAGEPAAYEELARRHQQAVYSVCVRMVGHAEDARDLAQDTLVRAYERLDRFDRSRPFRPWVLRIAMNLCLNAIKARRGHASLEESWHGAWEAPQGRAAGAGPAEAAVRREAEDRIRRALLALPETYRAVAVLRHTKGLRYEEIAEATGLPLGTVKTHLFRAKKLLRQHLADLFDEG